MIVATNGRLRFLTFSEDHKITLGELPLLGTTLFPVSSLFSVFYFWFFFFFRILIYIVISRPNMPSRQH